MSQLDAFLSGRRKALISGDRTWIDLVADRRLPSRSGPLKPPRIKRERLGLHAGLMLDRLVFWADKDGAVPGWVYKSYKDWEDSCALTRREAEGATERLRQCDFIETKVAKPPGKDAPVLHYRLKADVIQAALARHFAEQFDAVTDDNSSISPCGESSISPEGESLTAVPSSQILPSEDVSHAPEEESQDSIALPPAAAALAVVAPLQQATEGVEAPAEPPAMQEEPVQLCGCLWPFAAFVVPSGDAPAPADPDVSVTQHTEPPDPGAPAEPLALPGGEVEAVPVHPTRAASPPQRGAAGLQRASGACQPPAPPECGESYVPLRWLTPQEVGPVLDERGLRAMALGSPTLAARVAAMYQEELAHA